MMGSRDVFALLVFGWERVPAENDNGFSQNCYFPDVLIMHGVSDLKMYFQTIFFSKFNRNFSILNLIYNKFVYKTKSFVAKSKKNKFFTILQNLFCLVFQLTLIS